MTHLPENLPHIIKIAVPYVHQYGYLGVGGLILLENFGLPVPGETTLITAALFAGIHELNIFVVFFIALLATIVGNNIGYLIGSLGAKKIINRWGKYFLLPPERYKKFEDFLNHRGEILIVGSRFIDGLRQLNGIIAGSSDMRWLKYFVLNAIGALLWVLAFSWLGYFGGSHIQVFLKYQIYVTVAALVILIGYITYRHFAKRKSI